MKKDTYYFSHDFGARNDPKLQSVLMEHGAAGLGVFWCIVEQLYEQGGFMSLMFCKTIAYTLHVETSMVESIVKDFELFKYDDEQFWSESVNSRLKKRNDANESRRQKRKAYFERLKQSEQQDKSESSTSQLEVNLKTTTTKERKEKGEEKKEKESKGKDTSTDVDAQEINNINKKEEEKEEEKPTQKKRTVFKPPTLEEVKAYIAERHSPIDPVAFWNWYESKGWMVGSNKMKNWKAAVSTWERRENENNGNKTGNYQGGSLPARGRGVTLQDGTRFD